MSANKGYRPDDEQVVTCNGNGMRGRHIFALLAVITWVVMGAYALVLRSCEQKRPAAIEARGER